MPAAPWTPEEISAEILKKLKRDAEAALGEPVTRAVITVPAYFNDAQRNATKKAGELAGFTVERIVNEPTAAALAYGLDKLREKSKIAVYDLGGGTFDLSILELNEGVFQVLSTNGNTRLGGDDLDKRLIDFIVDKIKAAGGPDARRTRPRWRACAKAAEQAKIRLSTEEKPSKSRCPFIAPIFILTTRCARRIGGPDPRHHRPHPPALPALAGRRQARTQRPRSSHPRRRPDPHAAGAADRWRRFLAARNLTRRAATSALGAGLSPPPARA
jgi:hypothetical protein